MKKDELSNEKEKLRADKNWRKYNIYSDEKIKSYYQYCSKKFVDIVAIFKLSDIEHIKVTVCEDYVEVEKIRDGKKYVRDYIHLPDMLHYKD